MFHAAGVLDDGVLDHLDAGRLAGVLAVKAAGAAYLDELTAGLDLQAFVLFSSGAATLGSAGQGNYAAASAYLDALAAARRARGQHGLSVAWGPWGGGGLAQAAVVRARVRREGWPTCPRTGRPGAGTSPGNRRDAADRARRGLDASTSGGRRSLPPLLRDLPEAVAAAAARPAPAPAAEGGPAAGRPASGRSRSGR